MIVQGLGASAKHYAHARIANSARVGNRVSFKFLVFSFSFNLSFCRACPSSKCDSNNTDRSLIERHDSTLSAMRALLESSQEGSPSKDNPVENSQASTEATLTDDCSTSTISGRPSPVTPTSEMPTPTSGSQTATDQDDGACLTHEDHAAEVIEHAHERVSLKTRRPRLWRHGYEVFQSICTYNGEFCFLLWQNMINIFLTLMRVFCFVQGLTTVPISRLRVLFGQSTVKRGRSCSLAVSRGNVVQKRIHVVTS